MFRKKTRDFPSRIDPNQGFRQRRMRQRRRVQQRRIGAILVVVGVAVALTFGFRAVTGDDESSPPATTAEAQPAPAIGTVEPVSPTTLQTPGIELPDYVRGVHVTMPLVAQPGKMDEFIALSAAGLNTLQIDVKDEEGRIAFVPEASPLAQRVGAVGNFYDPEELADRVHAAGLFLVARIVVFQDPILAEARPKLSIKRPGGGNWTTNSGLGWTNPYNENVWKYNVDVAEAAAKAGFDEIMFDYIRFPTDGDDPTVYPGKRRETKAETIARFLAYAERRLDPLGVKVGAALFGLAATRNIGIGQSPKRMARHLDIVHPMVYPQAYGSGECNIDDPQGSPGRIVSCSLQDYRQVLSGRDVTIIPWLQDYGNYTLEEIRAQVAAAERWQTGGYLLWNGASVYTAGALDIK